MVQGAVSLLSPHFPPPGIQAGEALQPWCAEDVLWILVLEAQLPEGLPSVGQTVGVQNDSLQPSWRGS